jgi:hypothetical protein
MTVETFAICYNEARLLPYFMRHYTQYGSVTIFDNQSTDDSVAIARSLGAIVYPFESGGEFRDDIMVHVKDICWRESKADWCIVGDMDEFVYHRNLMWALKHSEGTVIMPRMFQMYADVYPTTRGQIYDEVKYGVEMRSKMCIIRPDQIMSMNYEVGCHHAYPEGNFALNVRTEIVNLHFKNMGLDYVTARNAELNARMSELNKEHGWSFHVAIPPEEVAKEFENVKGKLIQVV